jgi:NAD(P)-dependent dehydrogenase (short-subunit alcohol dehydrogenase family)
MQVADRHVAVTGAAGGIGRALIRRLAQEGSRALVAADRDVAGAQAIADEVGGLAVALDAGQESSVRELIAEATAANGPIDIFISNAGVPGAMGGPEAEDDSWDEAWRVNVMAHVWAARALLPEMVARGEGYLINTASAAGLLTQVSSLVYSVTKHAAVSLAEWLAIEYGDSGVRVSCICPQGVRTPMLDLAMQEPAGAAALAAGGLIEPEDVADAVIAGIRDERMLILPHENVAGFLAMKGSAPDRWIEGMRRLVREARSPASG